MWQSILGYIGKFLLLPLVKDGVDYLYKKIKALAEDIERRKKIEEDIRRSQQEQDQRHVEEHTNSKPGEPSGVGRVVDKLPGVK